MSYTKGPWEFDYLNESVTDSEGNTVVWETNSNIHDGNLIAAAPDLLEALEEAEDQFVKLLRETLDIQHLRLIDQMPTVIMMRAAIKRAKGEAE